MNISISFILWGALLVTWEVYHISLVKLVEAIKQESPQHWEMMGKPRFNYFFNTMGKEFIAYVKNRKYLALNNPKISRLALWMKISWAFVLLSVAGLFCSYAFPNFFNIK